MGLKVLFSLQDTMGWGENDRGVSFTFGAEVVSKFLHKHDFDLICRAHQVSIVAHMYIFEGRVSQDGQKNHSVANLGCLVRILIISEIRENLNM
jgi:hypothetical protein